MDLMKSTRTRKSLFRTFFLTILAISIFGSAFATDVFSPNDIFQIKGCTDAKISPDGEWIAYTVSVQRSVHEDPGNSYAELYLVSTNTRQIKPLVTGEVNVKSPQWSPDGKRLAFLMKRGEKAITQVWVIRIDGGEARQITASKVTVLTFKWHPDGEKIAYISITPQTDREKELKEKGFGFIFYEENLKHRNLYLVDLNNNNGNSKTKQLTKDITVWDFIFSPDGKNVAASVSPKNLIDHRYMFRKIWMINLASKKLTQLTDNPGKLGNYMFSPDGSKLAYAGSLTREDHQVTQAYVINIDDGDAKNLTMPDFRGDVNWVGWQDEETVIYRSGEGVWSTLSKVNANGGDREIILHSKDQGIIFKNLTFDDKNENFSMIGTTPYMPGNVYLWKPGAKMKKLTDLNSWLDKKKLGTREILNYQARDGKEIEGLLIKPVGYESGKRYPLIVYVHGGPEHHHYNEWLTRYSTPSQVMAGKGYAVLYLNYRASTGYGVAFAMEGYGDPAGKEYDDIADAIDHLVETGLVDKNRVGLAGGSYGGYASGWFATYYTKYVKAVCMFVGISDLISKVGTTDIAHEDMYVPMGKKLEDMWDLSLKRSPIYWAHQSKTATLIYGGADDPRVHPTQSMELYRRMKMNDHPAVRLVQYPGEKHGNSKQPGRIDVLYRQIQWFDWYVYDQKPLDGPMPPRDISDSYGIDLKSDGSK
jgi:dipeptidyl aminopeptidase/acylaminoacyl peptidase